MNLRADLAVRTSLQMSELLNFSDVASERSSDGNGRNKKQPDS